MARKEKIAPGPEKASLEETRTNLGLFIASLLLVIVLGGITYFYWRSKEPQPGKTPFLSKKRSLRQDVSKKLQPETEIKTEPHFTFDYPDEWGELSHEQVAGRTTYYLGPNSNFTLIVGSHYDPKTNQRLSVDQLTENLRQKEGCTSTNLQLNKQKWLCLSCLRSRSSSQQAYAQKNGTIFILHYQYNGLEITPGQAAETFDLVFESFSIQ